MIIFAQLLEAMVVYGMPQHVGGQGDPDLFMASVVDFAINNTILGVVLVVGGYLGTVLMNVAAFNQVISHLELLC